MTSSATRMYIGWQNVGIAMERMCAAIGDVLAPVFRQFADQCVSLYEKLQRACLYDALPAWLPYRAQIAQRWPKRWLPSSASVIRWMKGESDGMDQR